MANRFEDLDARLEELEVLRDDPEIAGTPTEFLSDVRSKAGEILGAANALTLEDFDEEYQEDEQDGEE